MSPFASLRRAQLLPTLLTIALLAPMFPRSAHADESGAPSPAGVGAGYDASLGIPETGNSVTNGTQNPVDVNPSTGVATVSVPFDFPRARGTAQPQLGLAYSSASGKGLGGYGWNMAPPSIERTPLSGSPTYADPSPSTAINVATLDRFSFNGASLVPICGIQAGICKANGIFLQNLPAPFGETGWTLFLLEQSAANTRFFWSPDHLTWLVQYKDGTTLELGKPLPATTGTGSWFGPAIDYDNDLHAGSPFRWNIVRQYDAARNTGGAPVNPIVYQWNTIPGDARLYLTDIFYTVSTATAGQPLTDPTTFANHVQLAYDTSFYQPAIPSFVPPVWRSSPNFVLSHVDVTAVEGAAQSGMSQASSRRLVRRYWIRHQDDIDYASSQRVLLSAIQIEGRCPQAGPDLESGANYSVSPTSGCPTLSPTTYSYQYFLDSGTLHTLYGGNDALAGAEAEYIYDINADGIPDIVLPKGSKVPNSFGCFPSSTCATASEFTQGGNVCLTDPSGSVSCQAYTSILPAPSTTSFFVPFMNVLSNTNDTMFPTGQAVTGIPTSVAPGNFAGDGRLDMLVAGQTFPIYTNPYYPTSPSATMSFSVLTPGTSSGTTGPFSLVSTESFAVNTWVSSTIAPNKSVGSWAVSPELIFGVVDVDSDGYPDLLTDTPAGQIIGTSPQVIGLPAAHMLALRPTVANPDGTFGTFSGTVPTATFSASGLPTSLYPAGAQYTAYVPVTDSPAANLFGPEVLGAPAPLILYQDMNGDGIVDWVTMPQTGGELSYWVGHADGTFGSCPSGINECQGELRFQGLPAGTSFSGVPSIPGGSLVAMHDVTADGYADLVVATTTSLTIYTNLGGTHFDNGTAVNLGALPLPWSLSNGSELQFGDMTGTGVDDLVIIQGAPGPVGAPPNLTVAGFPNLEVSFFTLNTVRPGLLTGIQNGYGASTTIQYASTQQLAKAASVAGNPWTTSSAQIAHHATSVTSTNGMPAPFTENREVDYSYRNPVFDPRDRQFVGFKQVTVTTVGDANEPTLETTTNYLTGTCQGDAPDISCYAPSVDRPWPAVRGLPTVTQNFDAVGHFVSAVHQTYHVQFLGVGLDGRGVRNTYAQTTDTYLSDSSLLGSPQTMTLTDATWEGGDAPNPLQSASVVGGPGGVLVQTETSKVLDTNGNMTSMTDSGVMSFSGNEPRGATVADQPIIEGYTWSLPPSDPTAFHWMPATITRNGFTPPSASAPADQSAALSIYYNSDGSVSSTQTTMSGAGSLARAGIGASPPTTATASGALVATTYLYDPFGNPTFRIGPQGITCSQTEYDTAFAQFAVSALAYRDGCSTAGVPNSSAAVVTQTAWDRGFEAVTMKTAPNNATTLYSYEGFGRLSTVTPPDPSTGLPSAAASMTFNYYDSSNHPSLDTAYPMVRQSEAVVTNATTGVSSVIWTYSDAWGQPLARIAPADPINGGDDGSWIVRGQVLRTARGAAYRTYQPYFWSGGIPALFPFNAAPPSAATTTTYDAFGRAVKVVGLDGATVTGSITYKALEEDVYDAEQIAGGHIGAYSYTVWDGHNQPVRQGRVVRPSAASSVFDEQVLTTHYTAAGKPWVITQSHSADSTIVQRTLQYDSLGDLVANLEPNTSTSGNGWRYVYDAAGRLVGTSDDNECGENVGYDGLGRVIWEDYSPCTSGQAKYSGPTGTYPNLSGVEVLRLYDTGASSLLPNQLSVSYDRASETSYAYDARARVTSISRSLAAPNFSSIGTIVAASNYSDNVFTRAFAYDALDRLTSESTGADAPELLGTDVTGAGTPTSKSMITATYSARGTLASVQGSYGALLRSNVLAADGAPLTAVLGDAAGTEVVRCYDGLRDLKSLMIERGSGFPPCGHTAVDAPSNPVAATPSLLTNDVYTPDLVGNPLSIVDSRNSAEWQPGAMPVSRSMTYDDTYRVTQVGYQYATVSKMDTFIPPTPSTTPYQTPIQPIASTPNRVTQQTFAYDWLGNTTSTKDPANLYFQRSLPVIQNGTAAQGPNRIVAANSGPYSIYNGKESGEYSNVTYDNAGNVTSVSEVYRGGSCSGAHCATYFSFEWDELGRLASAQRMDGTATTYAAQVSYVYDANGRRVLRAAVEPGAASDAGGVVYSAEVFPSLRLDQAVWEGDAYEHDANTETAYLVFAGSSYGKVLFTAPANVTPAVESQYVFLTIGDALGSASSTIDQATGELIERATYYGYGAVESDYHSPNWVSFREQHKYTGKEEDIEVGVVYFGARYYSPYLGRWMSPDPLAIHAVAGDPNPYAFVRGSPMVHTDPNGLDVGDGGCNNTDPGCEEGSSISASATLAGAESALKDVGQEIWKGLKWIGNAAKSVFCGIFSCGGGGGGGETAAPPPPPPPSDVDPYSGWGDVGSKYDRWGAGGMIGAGSPSGVCQGDSCSIAQYRRQQDTAFLADPVASSQDPARVLRLMSERHGFMVGGMAPLVESAAEFVNGAGSISRILPGSLSTTEQNAVLDTLSHIDNGTVPTGATATRWGAPFNNMAGDLPGVPGAQPTPYTEYRVAPGPGVSGAGTNRIVVDNASGNIYYTWTHYGQAGDPSFVLIRW